MKKLTILFVTNNYTPYSGGVVSSITATVQALQKQGHKVFVVAPQFLTNHSDDSYNIFRVPSLFRFLYKKNPMAILWQKKHFIQKVITQLQPDLIHVHHPFLLGSVAAKLAKKNNIPVVFTHHTLYDQYLHYLPFPQFATRLFVNRKVRNFCNFVDNVIAPSAAIKQILIERGVTKPIEVIPSGLQDTFVSKQPYLKTKTRHDPFELLVVSRFQKEKNIPFLLDMFSELNGNYQLTLAGYGQEYEQLQNYAYTILKLSPDKVFFIYRPRKETLRDLYLDADLFLFSSKTDTQGLVLAEAMAGSTPVIALDGPGQRDIIKQGENGFIVADKNEMKEKIIDIGCDKQLHKHLQTNAFKMAQRYTSKALIETLLLTYFHMINKKQLFNQL